MTDNNMILLCSGDITTATVYINDEKDTPTLQFMETQYTVEERDTTLSIPIRRTGAYRLSILSWGDVYFKMWTLFSGPHAQEQSCPPKVFWIVSYFIIFSIFCPPNLCLPFPPFEIFLPLRGMFSSCGPACAVINLNIWKGLVTPLDRLELEATFCDFFAKNWKTTSFVLIKIHLLIKNNSQYVLLK